MSDQGGFLREDPPPGAGLGPLRVAGVERQPDGDWVSARASGNAYDRDGVKVQTTTPLGSAGTYTSGWVDTDGWNSLEVCVMCSVVSGAGGIALDFTDDVQATTPVVRATATREFGPAEAAVGSAVYRFSPRMDGVRLRYVNGGTAQSAFFLEMDLRDEGVELPQGPFDSTVNQTNTAVMTRSGLVIPDAAGNYRNLERGANNGLDVGVVEFEAEAPIKALSSFVVTRATITTTPTAILTPTANRRSLSLKAITSAGKIIYIAENGAKATTGSGFPLNNQESVDLELDATSTIWASCDSGTQSLAIIEGIL